MRSGEEVAAKLVAAIDFDGTLCEFAYPSIGVPKEGASRAMLRLHEMGYHIIIYTCRTSKHLPDLFPHENFNDVMNRRTVKEMVAWLDRHGIFYDEIDDGTKGKPIADAYIDDRGIAFHNNWQEIVDLMELRQSPALVTGE